MENAARQTLEANILTVVLLTCVHRPFSNRVPHASHPSSRRRRSCRSRRGLTTPSIRQRLCRHRPHSRSTTSPTLREVWLEVRGLSRRTSQVVTHRLLRRHSVICSADVERIGDIDEVFEERIDEAIERHIDEIVRNASTKQLGDASTE